MSISDSNINLDDFIGFHKISYEKKKAKDWKWIEDNANLILDHCYSSPFKSRYEQIDMNYQFANARGIETPNINDVYASSDVKHYDLVRRILNRSWGQQQKTKLKAIVYDTSKYNINMRKKKTIELYQEYLKTTVINPIKEKITQEEMMKAGVQNPQQMNPEQQQQIQFQIDNRFKVEVPGDIIKYMRSEYKSPSEQELQNLIDWSISEFNLKYIFDEAYKDLTIAGFNCVEMDIINNYPFIEQVNPKKFKYFNPNTSSPFISDGEWFSYEKEMGYFDFINSVIKDEKMLKEFSKDVLNSSDSAYRRQIRGELPYAITKDLAREHSLSNPIGILDPHNPGSDLIDLPDINSQQGQDFYSAVMSVYGERGSNDRLHNFSSIPVTRVVFSSLDKLQCVFRDDPYNKGEYQYFWVGENYEPNKRKDKKVITKWFKAFYECKRAGTDNSLFFDKRRVLFQNRSLNDPATVYPPFEGVEFSKLHGNSKSIAPINFGMPYNREYNIVKNEMERIQERDLGSIMLFPKDTIPDEYTPEEFFQLVKTTGFAPIDLSDLEYQQVAAQLFKEVNLSKNQELAGKLQLLEKIEKDCIHAMGISASEMGQAPPSLTASNNQQNIIQGSYAAQDLNGLHKMFEKRVLERFGNLVRNSLRENKHLQSLLLSEMGIIELNLNKDTLDLSDIAIRVENDPQKVLDLMGIKNLLHSMVQNQMIDLSETIKMQFNDNPAAMLNLAEEAKKKREDAQKAQAEREEKARAEEMKFKRERAAKEDEFRKMELEIKKMEVELNFDINNNNVPDIVEQIKTTNEGKIEVEKMRLEAQAIQAEKNRELKLKELNEKIRDREVKSREIDGKLEIEKSKLNASKSKPKK